MNSALRKVFLLKTEKILFYTAEIIPLQLHRDYVYLGTCLNARNSFSNFEREHRIGQVAEILDRND